MSIGTLWTNDSNRGAKAIRAVAAYGGLQIDLPASYKHLEDNHKPEFRAKFPHGKIPAFEGKDGFNLTETYAIARYVASLAPNSGLLTGDPKTDALIDQWASFALTEINSHVVYDYLLAKGIITPYNKPIHQHIRDRTIRAYKTLNAHLVNNTFVVGERLTVADFILAGALFTAFTTNFDAELRKELPHVVRYFETVVNQPKVKDVFGPVELIEKALAYTPPPKEKKEAPPKPPAAPKPKKAAEEDDDDDEKPIEEPKAKNPLDLLPKSTFNLEDWKRAYSNMDTRGAGGALEWFYQHYDPEGFSIWEAKYKYNEELTQVFMSSNLIGGLYARLEASRKYLFGSMGVFGTNNDSFIEGVFVMRGQEFEPVMSVAPDWESYEFTKLDLNDPKKKEKFEAILAWDYKEEERADGKSPRAWADGKVFK